MIHHRWAVQYTTLVLIILVAGCIGEVRPSYMDVRSAMQRDLGAVKDTYAETRALWEQGYQTGDIPDAAYQKWRAFVDTDLNPTITEIVAVMVSSTDRDELDRLRNTLESLRQRILVQKTIAYAALKGAKR